MSLLEESLQRTTTNHPERLAVQFRNQRFTYESLSHALDATAKRTGSIVGWRILVLLPEGLPTYLCHLHFFLGGAVTIPVTVQITSPNLIQLCDRVQPQVVVTTVALRARHAPALEKRIVWTIRTGANQNSGMLEFDTWGEQRTPAEPRATSNESLRLIVFTSGSTGQPKGVCLGENTILAAAGMNVSFLGLNSTRRSMVTVPLYDYYGFIQLYSHLLAGTGYIFGESVAFAESIFQRIQEENVTDLVLVPHTLRELLKSNSARKRAAFQSLKFITSSSDALTPELLRDVFSINPELKIVNIYGLTEAGRACFRIIDLNSPASSSIGRPAPGVDIAVAGTRDQPGEIVIRGPNVMLGYFQGIASDGLTWKPCSEMPTGDLGYIDEGGEIILLGRRDHMFNIKGAKIHPLEIERIALQCAGITEAQARTRAGPDGEVVITIDVVPADNATFSHERVQTHLRKNLAPLFVPHEIKVVQSLNRTELGSKVIRR